MRISTRGQLQQTGKLPVCALYTPHTHLPCFGFQELADATELSNPASIHAMFGCRYQLMHTVRVHTGADDDAYSCMGWGPDKEGINGVWLRKDVPLQVRAGIRQAGKSAYPTALPVQKRFATYHASRLYAETRVCVFIQPTKNA